MLSRKHQWLCRRGMRELDLLIGRYLADGYPTAESAEQRAFESLLELHDDALWHYVNGDAQPEDAALAALVRKFQNFPAPQA